MEEGAPELFALEVGLHFDGTLSRLDDNQKGFLHDGGREEAKRWRL